MKKREFLKTASKATSGAAPPGLPSIQDVQRLEAPLRTALEMLDDNVRRAHDRISADARLSPEEMQVFAKASITVILTIAASLLETAQERTCEPLAEGVFGQGAAEAFRWAQERKNKTSG